MQFSLTPKVAQKSLIVLIDQPAQNQKIEALTPGQKKIVAAEIETRKVITIQEDKRLIYIVYLKQDTLTWKFAEQARKSGADLQLKCNEAQLKEIAIISYCQTEQVTYHFAEGLALANYQFLKYKSDAKKLTHSLQKLFFADKSITLKEMQHLNASVAATYTARDLVNEPVIYLSAVQLSESIKTIGKQAGFKVTVWNKAKIAQEKMGGILAVNSGSQLPPTFSIMEYKATKPLNKKPIVLVGKGVVYDTGGLSLKPTPASMDRMKSDMSGAALVTAAMQMISTLKLPLHVVALVPATDNRPGENAYTPGDVITMYSGTTVEVLNTDAEGRLILADALHYAKRLQPEYVFDFATLTGAAAAAVGDVGIVTMGTAPDVIKQKLSDAGFRQYERLVEMPLWDEYDDMIKSDIADLKNIGGPYGGAITAGKFLQHFTDYNWMHFDIAGVSFNTARKKYLTVGGTGFGLRMLVDFLEHYQQ